MSFNEIKLNQKFLIREYWIKMLKERRQGRQVSTFIKGLS